MRRALGFSLLLFAPLLIAFLLPPLLLLPTGVLVTLLSIVDSTISVSEGFGYQAWVGGPIVAAIGLFLAGLWFHSRYLRAPSRKTVWIAIWVMFSVALFAATWLTVSLLTSIGASDYRADEFFRRTAGVAALLTLVFQPAVGLWLVVAARVWRGFMS